MLRRKTLVVLAVLIICFIWGNSAMPSKPSNALSDSITQAVGGEVISGGKQPAHVGKGLTSSHVRKLAHLTEFATIGLCLAVIVCTKRRGGLDNASRVMLYGILLAVTDETIQMLNDRTSSIRDVWIDCSGYVVGAVLGWYIIRVWRRRRANHGHTDQTH